MVRQLPHHFTKVKYLEFHSESRGSQLEKADKENMWNMERDFRCHSFLLLL